MAVIWTDCLDVERAVFRKKTVNMTILVYPWMGYRGLPYYTFGQRPAGGRVLFFPKILGLLCRSSLVFYCVVEYIPSFRKGSLKLTWCNISNRVWLSLACRSSSLCSWIYGKRCTPGKVERGQKGREGYEGTGEVKEGRRGTERDRPPTFRNMEIRPRIATDFAFIQVRYCILTVFFLVLFFINHRIFFSLQRSGTVSLADTGAWSIGAPSLSLPWLFTHPLHAFQFSFFVI